MPRLLVAMALLGITIVGSPATHANEDFPSGHYVSARPLTAAVLAARPPDEELLADLDSPGLPEVALSKRVQRYRSDNIQSALLGLSMQVKRLLNVWGREYPTGRRGYSEYIPTGDELRKRRETPLTTKSDLYNVFFLDDPAVGQLYWFVKRAFHAYAREYNLTLDRTWWLHGWANCFRRDDGISFHSHGVRVSGNFAVNTAPGSHTRYKSHQQAEWDVHRRWHDHAQPFADDYRDDLRHMSSTGAPRFLGPDEPEFRGDFEPGDLTLFDGFVKHQSNDHDPTHDAYYSSRASELGIPDCRITIAFDVWPETFEYDRGHVGVGPMMNWHTLPLFDPNDPWFHKLKSQNVAGDEGASPIKTVGEQMRDAIRDALDRQGVEPLFSGPASTTHGSINEWNSHLEKVLTQAQHPDIWADVLLSLREVNTQSSEDKDDKFGYPFTFRREMAGGNVQNADQSSENGQRHQCQSGGGEGTCDAS